MKGKLVVGGGSGMRHQEVPYLCAGFGTKSVPHQNVGSCFSLPAFQIFHQNRMEEQYS